MSDFATFHIFISHFHSRLIFIANRFLLYIQVQSSHLIISLFKNQYGRKYDDKHIGCVKFLSKFFFYFDPIEGEPIFLKEQRIEFLCQKKVFLGLKKRLFSTNLYRHFRKYTQYNFV